MKTLKKETKRSKKDVMIMNAMKRKKNYCMATIRKLNDNNKIDKVDH